ncbi:CAMP factor pore-forming toxin Cfb-I [Streptococcus agalactiae]|uniref:CAMP factor pore-forming toxin Cfb-I n=1 Tax=Streptococcus agalactiae TaxID=1311 RepID=UPI00085C8443|nr:CAMP factor pore-forming toxin Cfb-I [Streptococcus agalactiae]
MNVKHMMYLSGTLVAGALLFSPAVLEVHADQVTTPQVVNHVNSNNQAQQMAQKLDQDSIQLRNIKDNVQETDYEKPVNEAITSVEKLKTSLRANPETVYDLNSIGSRVEALTDVIEAITFSTQHLANKVSQANIDMGFGITKLVIRILDPFASVDSIKAQVNDVKALEQKVLTYPDLKPTDRATIYTKSKLDKEIWNTRFTRDKKVLNVKEFKVYNTLNKAITHAVGVQLNPNVTVQQVDQEIVTLQAALQTALK